MPDTHITLTRVSCSSPTPSSNHGQGYGGHISLAKTYPIPEVSSTEADLGACPLGFSHAPELLALIGLTDWMLRHSLHEKTI